MQYGGFWIRVLAYLIDLVPLVIIGVVLAFATGQPFIDTSAEPEAGFTDILGLVIGIAYFVGFESSPLQGTPGKRALGLIVTDHEGRRITPLRALGRYLAKILSGLILLIGYIMVAFTERKQGLHDIIASTLVLRADPGQGMVDTTVFN